MPITCCQYTCCHFLASLHAVTLLTYCQYFSRRLDIPVSNNQRVTVYSKALYGSQMLKAVVALCSRCIMHKNIRSPLESMRRERHNTRRTLFVSPSILDFQYLLAKIEYEQPTRIPRFGYQQFHPHNHNDMTFINFF